ncbi:hypothetical protein ACHQM5_024774 [Ranunculus cassubicifolius]
MAIPEEFKNLSLLMDLDLHSNKFSGHLKTILSKQVVEPLGHYNSIDLSNNRFVGPLDENIGNHASMSSIQTLILSRNPLGGSIPGSLGKLSGLKRLELRGNGLSGGIPAGLGEAKELTSVVLSGNNLNGHIPQEVLNFESLVEFDVSRNNLTGRIPAHKASIPASAFKGNLGLCGAPLSPCKHT